MLKTKNILRRIENAEEKIKPKDKAVIIFSFRDVETNKCSILGEMDKEYDSVEDYIKEKNITTKLIKIFDFPVYPNSDNSEYLNS